MPWLLWNYERQTLAERELVIVDSSAEPVRVEGRDDVRVVRVWAGMNVAEKRNVAVGVARGEIVTWFDDDDWHHPRKLEILAEAMAGEWVVQAGHPYGWFVNLANLQTARYSSSARLLLPTSGFRRSMVMDVRFVEDGVYASDTAWLMRLERLFGERTVRLEREDLSFWLCHRDNLYNRPGRWTFDRTLEELTQVVGQAAWGDTDAALAELRGRLGYG